MKRVTIADAPLRTALDLTLSADELEYVAAFLGDDYKRDDEAVRLLIGDGHSGYGLYAAHPEYPEEGAILVKNLPDPGGVRGSAPLPEPVDPCRPWCTCGAWPHKSWCGYRGPSGVPGTSGGNDGR